MRGLFSMIYFTFLFTGATDTLAQTVTYPNKFTVALDGTGDYKTIQEAVNAVRDLSQQLVIIRIKSGIYHEKVSIPSWKCNIRLVGENKENTVITNSDYSGKNYPITKDAYGKDKYSTYTSYTVLVQGNDIQLENLTITNASGRVGQAVALHVDGDRVSIKNCKLLGNQDTLFAATEGSRQYYHDCYIEGTTDFIFGKATAVFQNCTLKSLADSYVTAAATTKHQKFGFVFIDCKLTADSGVRKVYLGRPWRQDAKTVFIKCNLGNHIVPEGWHNWGNPLNEKTVLYGEYQSGGASNIESRVKWSKQLTAREAKQYRVPVILGGNDNWQPVSK